MKFYLEKIDKRHVFDVQYSRDFLILRYFHKPNLLFIDGGDSYYGASQKHACCVDLRSIIPRAYASMSDEFFRKSGRVEVQNIGFIVYCDLKTNMQMLERLFKALYVSNLNNYAICDISFVLKFIRRNKLLGDPQ